MTIRLNVHIINEGTFDTTELHWEPSDDLVEEAKRVFSAYNKNTWDHFGYSESDPPEPGWYENYRRAIAEAGTPNVTPWDWFYEMHMDEARNLGSLGIRVATWAADYGGPVVLIWSTDDENEYTVGENV